MDLKIEPASPIFDEWSELLALILKSFAYMAPLINPPSSANRLTLHSLREKAETESLYLARDEATIVGCAFFRREYEALYVGKIAILPAYQEKGIGRQFIQRAEALARSLDLNQIELETRVELKQNHAAFNKLGFVKTGEKSHQGFSRPTSITMTKFLS